MFAVGCFVLVFGAQLPPFSVSVVDLERCSQVLDSALEFCRRGEVEPREAMQLNSFANQLLGVLLSQQDVGRPSESCEVPLTETSFFDSVGILPREMKRSVKKSVEYFSNLGFSENHFERMFRENAKDFLENPSKYDVSIGSGDCHERSVLFMRWLCLYRDKIISGEFSDIPRLVKNVFSLSWILQEFGLDKEGKESFEGCSVPETRASIPERDIVRFPVKAPECQKKLQRSALDFFARVRVMIGIMTKLGLYHDLRNLEGLTYTPVSGVDIPVLDHDVSLRAVFENIGSGGWPCALMMTHFSNGRFFGHGRYPLRGCVYGEDASSLLICFEMYTVNLSESEKEELISILSQYDSLESSFLTLGRLISGKDAESRDVNGVSFICEKLSKEMIEGTSDGSRKGIGGRHIWVDTVGSFFKTEPD